MAGEALGLCDHHQIPEDPHLGLVGDCVVPAGNHLFVHGISIGKRSPAVRLQHEAMRTSRDSVLGEHREAILAAAARNKADSIALVGSVARGDDTDDSDCDLLARFIEGASLFDQAGLKLDLEKMLGCKLDVLSVDGLKDKHSGLLADAISL